MPYESQQPEDATADFARTLNDPTKWIIKAGVPLFKAHVRKDPATGAEIRVDSAKLYRIAGNMQRLERQGGVPVRGTLGHTEPGKPETNQPPVAVWYRNARVQPFGPQGELAVVGDEWLDPQYARDRKNYPYRSAEYYDDTEQITGVALLTRDPYLDLGVVAYSKSATGPVRYSANGRAPYLYLLQGEPEMNPQAPGTTPIPYGAPYAPYGHQPGNHPPRPYGSGPDTHTPVSANAHNHPGGWNNGVGYAAPPFQGPGGPPQGPPGMAPPPAPPGTGVEEPEEGGVAGLHAMHHHLTQAAEHLARYLAQRGPTSYEPQDSPFPPQEQEMPPQGPPGTAADPYARYPQSQPRGYYSAPAAPTPYAAPPLQQPARTITGLPVGYQMELDRLTYQLNEQDRAMKVLLYERDQADTDWCVSEIRRLAAVGFQVGDYEVSELKSKPREHRGAYLQHIVTKYQKVGTEPLPPMMGDPTAQMYPEAPENRPASEGEMEAALKYVAHHRVDYATALNAVRNGTPAPTMYGPPGYGQAFDRGGFEPPAFDPASFQPSPNGAV